MDDGQLAFSPRRDRPLADDAAHACKAILGRDALSVELETPASETPGGLLERLYCGDEFKTCVVAPTVLTGRLPEDRFGSPPPPATLTWVARFAPLDASTRILIQGVQGWSELHRHLVSDRTFTAHMKRRGLSWSLDNFRSVLARGPSGRELGPRRSRDRLRVAPPRSCVDEASRIDDAAMGRLSALATDHLAVLFDTDHILRHSGELFASGDEAMTAYFVRGGLERFSTTPLFDAEHYTGDPQVQLAPGVDPFSHFIAHSERGGADPHRLISRRSLMAGVEDTSLLERLCDVVLGEARGHLHPLLDLVYIGSQPGACGLSCAEILARVCDVDAPLPFSPHPLFCIHDYRRRNAPDAGNELQHYIRLGQGALSTHPLLSPTYIQAARTDAHASPRRSLLEIFLETWPQTPIDPSIFVDIKHLNHQFAWRGDASPAEPVSRAVAAEIADASMLHPNLDSRILDFAFGDLSHSNSAVDLLRAAFDFVPEAPQGGDRPLVSVVMVTYGKPVYTAIAVLAASRALASTPHEIIVVENGGELMHHEELRRIFARVDKLQMAKLEDNRYFGEGSNIGADMAIGEYILFLNNDCFLAPDFGRQLDALLNRGGRRFDALGAALLFPDGDLQEFGGTITDDGQVLQRGKHLPPGFLDDLPDVQQADYASAACLCLSREALDRVGGFDPLYEPLYFEDTDLCRRLTKSGMAIHVSSRLRAMHVENATTREFLGAGFDAQVAANREAFARRWLKDAGRDAYLSVARAAPATTGRLPKALVYTPFDLTPGGGERYLLSVARKLSESHDVVIATPRRMSRARVEFARHALAVAPFPFRVGETGDVLGREGPFDIAFVMGNEIVPPIPAVARLNIFHLQFPFPWRTTGATRFDRLQGFDLVMVNSSFTAHWTRERLREAGVRTPPAVEVVAPPVQALPSFPRAVRTPGAPLRLVNVGRFFQGGHCKRQDVVLKVVAELRARDVAAEATLLGAVSGDGSAAAYFKDIAAQAQKLGGIEVVRNAGRTEIARALARSDVYLHCCGFGVDVSLQPEAAEHYGIAVSEAIRAGCYPVVVDSGGPVEIIRQAGRGDVYTTVRQAADAILRASGGGRLDEVTAMTSPEGEDIIFDRAFGEMIDRLSATTPPAG